MSERAGDLSEREKDVLRLLLGGHDAKSTARTLDVSVHSVNERLRSARRKLGVSSSREAARLLGQAEGDAPQLLGTEEFGLPADRTMADVAVGRSGPPRPRRPIVPIVGGALLMSIIAIAALLVWGHPHRAAPDQPARWGRIASAAESRADVRNVVRLDGNQLTWNGDPIAEAQLRQFLDITTRMSPQPTLIYSPSEQTKPARVESVRGVIEDVLQCTPANCQEVIAGPAR